jgi:hypothetical protein
VISKLYSKYAEQRDLGAEGRITSLVKQQVNNSGLTPILADPYPSMTPIFDLSAF